jgi:hypothetical protein
MARTSNATHLPFRKPGETKRGINPPSPKANFRDGLIVAM